MSSYIKGVRKVTKIVLKTAKKWQRWDFTLNFQITQLKIDRE